MENNEPKKILIINGSPHKEKSTTMMITDAFTRGMLSVGGYQAETVHVSELKVKPCTGCLSCWGRTEGECVIKTDDMPALKRKIIEADIVIGSFPLYYFGVPGILKVVIDRLLSMVKAYHGQLTPKDNAPAHEFRYPKPGKKYVLISGCAYTETDVVYVPVRKQFDLILGKDNYTALFCPQFKTMADNGGARKERILSKFVKAGEEFAKNGCLSQKTIESATKPPFSSEVYKTILNSVWAGEKLKGGLV